MRLGDLFSVRPGSPGQFPTTSCSNYCSPVANTSLKRFFGAVGACLIASMCLLLLRQPGDTFFDFPSWRNVTMYQVVKMHLSGRPTHTNFKVKCHVPLQRPLLSERDLDTSKMVFHERAREKLKFIQPHEEWKRAFAPSLSRDDKIALVHLYTVFSTAMKEAGLEHFVMHGSALGVWRFHGITPWDDDIDLGIDVKDWVNVKNALGCIEGYTLDSSSNSKWGFWKTNGSLIQNDPTSKRWPFLDLFLYSYDDTYVWGLNYVHLRKFVFKREDMFPPQLVPFEGMLVPVPRNLRTVLANQFVEPEVCVSQSNNHRIGQLMDTVRVPCEQIADLYTMYLT